LLALYADAGVTPDKQVIPYCATGVRSAVTYFTLRLLGYDDVALYTGSWDEWGNREDTPKVTGDEPG
jgi:thiosulfate/3-mercaptopyruvate sulfurtransferase